MIHFRHHILYLIAVLSLALPIAAQDAKKPYLEGLLESTLSSPSLGVRVTGLQGTFSSSAKVDKIEISDPDGVWLIIEQAQLDWTRSALLQKRVEIQNLSAGTITVLRAPLQEESETSPEAGSFSVPELPVALNIENINADELFIDAALFGLETRFEIAGRINIEDGNFDIDLGADNLDDTGTFQIKTLLKSLERTIELSVIADEPENGLIVNLLDIPNKPALSIVLDGSGPKTAFTTSLSVKTNDSQRLTGQAITAPNIVDGVQDGLKIDVDLDGDLAPLFDQQYQRFFGTQNQLNATALWRDNQEVEVSNFDLSTEALNVSGLLQLAADRTPTLIELEALIKDTSGDPVLLPISGTETFIDSAKITLDYDVTTPWYAVIDVAGFSRDGITVGDVKLQGFGEIPQPFVVKAPSDLLFSAQLEGVAKSLAFTNSDFDDALGNEIRTSANVVFRKEEPVRISELTLSDGNIDAGFSGRVDGLETALNTTGILIARIADISVFSKVMDQRLDGRVGLTAEGSAEILTGAFDLDIDSRLTSVSIGNPTIDGLLRGQGDGKFLLSRTENGLFFNSLNFSNPQFNVSADGQMQSDQATINLNGVINNLSVISDGLTGPLRADGTVVQNGTKLSVDLTTMGIAGLRADVSGSIPLDDGAWGLSASGQAPLALADPFLTSSAAKARGDVTFDLALNGQPSLQNISGRVTSTGASIALPNQRLSVKDIAAAANISGGAANLQVDANLSVGGRISSTGRVNLNTSQGLPSDLDIVLTNVTQRDRNFYKTTLNGNLNLSGPLMFNPSLTGQVDLSDTEVNLQTSPAPTLSFLPQIVHKNESALSRQTRQRANLGGDVETADDDGYAMGLNLLVRSPARIFVRGRGLDAELGGQVRLTGTTQSVSPIGSFNLIRGRLDIFGKRLALSEGNITMAGSLDPRIRIVATRSAAEFDTSIVISGLVSDPKFSFESNPSLPEDEILVQLFFDRSLEEISPLQALQLAAAVRELTGRGGTSFVERLRRKLDIDDFSIETTEDGTTGVRAGKYLSDNVYTDVSIAENGQSEITINLDINKNISASGALKQSGESKLGIFFTKDY